VRAEFPEKFAFLFEPHSDKYLYGGRDGMKSWGMARALLIMGAQHKLRWLCARETMKSLAESVHHLLEEQIESLGLQSFYVIEKAQITGTKLHTTGMYGSTMDGKGEPLTPGYSQFVFAGLHHNVSEIKSMEGLDGIWIEEADNVSQKSWDTVIPTIRKQSMHPELGVIGSEVWCCFNPKLATDPTYKHCVLNPPPGAVSVKTSYLDNKWLSEISKTRIAHMRDTEPAKFAHIYGGEPDSEVEGAIFGPEMKAAAASGRIGDVPYDRTRPVDTVWDLGFGDPTAIWFLQAYDGWYNFIDHLEADRLEISDYLVKLQDKGYLYGTDWLPHDGIDTIIHGRLAGDRSMSIEQLMRNAGRKPRLVPKMLVTEQINAARTIFPTCRFDAIKCADGLQSLRCYQWPALSADGVGQRKPLHNQYSHSASAFMGAAVAVRQPKADKPPAERRRMQPSSPWS
jgi:phage terminase large subunit